VNKDYCLAPASLHVRQLHLTNVSVSKRHRSHTSKHH
jgi:hypothetical protein